MDKKSARNKKSDNRQQIALNIRIKPNIHAKKPTSSPIGEELLSNRKRHIQDNFCAQSTNHTPFVVVYDFDDDDNDNNNNNNILMS